jgi:hypothetical protein
MDPERRFDHQEDFREAFLSDDIFPENHHLPARRMDAMMKDIPSVLPKWLDETRIVCFLVGVFGVVYTLFNLDFFYWQIKNAFLLNATLLFAIGGFVNYIAYPYALKYTLVNHIYKPGLLKGMRSFMLVFSLMALFFLFTFPVTGLGLSMILIPAPLLFSLFTRKYVDFKNTAPSKVHFPFGVIFNQDLRRLAWLSFIIIFTFLVVLFFGLVFNII